MGQLAQLLEAHAIPFMLVLARLGGLFATAPTLSGLIIPVRFKALLVVVLSAGSYPLLIPHLRPEQMGELDAFVLVPLLALETLVGFSIGLLATAPLMALEAGGVVMGQQMGFGLARVYNPEADYDVDVLGQLLFFVASGIFFAVGGVDSLLRAVLGTFERVPLGGMAVGSAPLEMFAGLLDSSLDLAMRVAAPVAGIVLLLVLVFGVVAKTMPQINIMSVGFTIKIFAGVAMLAAAIYAVHDGTAGAIDHALGVVRRFVEGLPAS